MNVYYDYLIIGAGIIGMSIAYELRKRDSNLKIVVIEKESTEAQHSSGRNSGVLHAGFYYSADTLKAKFTVDGNKKIREFCNQQNITINETKKIVIAKDEDELKGLYELERRAKINKVEVKIIDENELKDIDDNIKTYKKALYSPSTASVNPRDVCLKLKDILVELGVDFYFNTKYEDINLSYRYLINSAGLYADKIAHSFGLAKDYTILPFKGVYLKYKKSDRVIKTNVYPVPNLKNPFLGVHYTVTADNNIKIGPTAIPVFWRENYKGFKGFNLNEFLEIIYYEIKLFILNSFNFRTLAISEMKNYIKSNLVKKAKDMLYYIDDDFEVMPAGIRAQLLNKKTNELEMDFKIEHSKNSTHILNAVSPAFTCSFAFSEYIVDEIIKNRGEKL